MGLLLNILLTIVIVYIIFIIVAFLVRKYMQKNLRHILRQVTSSLNDNNIEYWVDFGTLLGLHRDGDIIMGDNDCDICIWEKDREKVKPVLLDICLKTKNFTFKEYDGGSFKIFYHYPYVTSIIIHCDIYGAKVDENNIENILIPDSPVTPKYLLEEFETVELPFHNSTIVVRQPSKWKELLNYRYTKKWTKKINKWWLGYFTFSGDFSWKSINGKYG